MSIENMIISVANADRILDELGANPSVLAGLTNIPAGTLSEMLRGVRPAPFERSQLIIKWLTSLRRFVAACQPIPVDCRNVSALRELIQEFEAGTLNISVHRLEPVTAPEPQFHVFMGNQYFVRRSANPLGKIGITGSFQSSGATRVSKECGDKLVAAQAAEGHRAQLVKSTSMSEDGACDDFAALWGEAEQVQQ